MAILHTDAAVRFDELGSSILTKLKPTAEKATAPFDFIPDVHPVADIGADDIIGTPKLTTRVITMEEEEVGRETANGKFALDGEDYQGFRKLAEAIMRNKGVAAIASVEYVMDRIWDWVEQSSSASVTRSLSEHLEQVLAAEVTTSEFWMPLHRTHCPIDLKIGDVRFLTLTRDLMERWEHEAIAQVKQSQVEDVQRLFARQRSKMQGSLAAVLSTTGVPTKARDVALETADRAVALLRFLSPANWTPKLRSYCTLLGHEAIAVSHTLELVNGRLEKQQESAVRGQVAWIIQRDFLPGGQMDLITPLNALAGGKSTLQRQMLDSLLIYSRNSISVHPADKLLFIMVALESMLLKNDNEPIQKNIAERMALLVGDSVDSRLSIIANATSVYGMRSQFVHHGRTDVDAELVSKFMLNAWTCFCVLLGEQYKYASKEELILALEKKKMGG